MDKILTCVCLPPDRVSITVGDDNGFVRGVSGDPGKNHYVTYSLPYSKQGSVTERFESAKGILRLSLG